MVVVIFLVSCIFVVKFFFVVVVFYVMRCIFVLYISVVVDKVFFDLVVVFLNVFECKILFFKFDFVVYFVN